MARQASIDKQAALDMMRAGEKDSVIAERFGTSRQAANLLRKTFVKEGKLDVSNVNDEQVSRFGTIDITEGQQAADKATAPNPPEPGSTSYPTFEQIGNWVIQLIREASEARKLRQENAELLRATESLQTQIERLQENLKQAQAQIYSTEARSAEFENAVKDLDTPFRIQAQS